MSLVFTQDAEQAAQRYLVLVTALRGIHARAVTSPDLGSAKLANAIARDAYEVGRSFASGEEAIIAERTAATARNSRRETLLAIGATGTAETLPGRTSELLTSSQSELHSEIVVQIERDVTFLKRALRSAAMEVEIAAQAQGIARRAAQIQRQLRTPGELRFHFQDRTGRRWPSQKFVRVVWRQHLLDVHNQVVMATLAEHGLDRAMIRHPDPRHRYAGQVIGLVPGLGLPTYAEIREEAFHPNAEAVLAPVSQD
jgi:hypothetical protein